ncbi:MAG: TylF/MycF/NovP-related O-methyltransferase [Caulobacterales bacterium]
MKLRDAMAGGVHAVLHSEQVVARRFADVAADQRTVYAKVKRHTMTSPERVLALCGAVDYVVARGVPGAVVECGVWKGGSSMAVAYTLIAAGRTDRDLYLFDTFEGMTAPSEHDRRAADSAPAGDLLDASTVGDKIRCYSSLEEVRANMLATGYPAKRVTYVRGKVEDTLPDRAPDQIAILRLDTDWYESTRHELEHLYPRLSPGGVLIIDDYGAWEGARKAVDEYFGARAAPILLNRIDDTGRIGVKLG